MFSDAGQTETFIYNITSSFISDRKYLSNYYQLYDISNVYLYEIFKHNEFI